MVSPTHHAGARYSPQVYVCNFDLPQHNIPAGAQPPPALPTLYRLLTVSEARLAAPIMNMLVDTAHIGARGWAPLVLLRDCTSAAHLQALPRWFGC